MKNKVLLILIVLTVIVISIIVVISAYQKSLAPDSSSAATNVKTVLTLARPVSVAGVPIGTNIAVDLSFQNTTDITAGELVFTFDPAVLNAVSIVDAINPNTGDVYVLALLKNINNTTGRITLDVANLGPGDFPVNTTLLTFNFTLKRLATSTTIATGSETTLGVPNSIVSSGLGSLQLKFTISKCGDGTTQTPNDSGINEQCDNGANNGVTCTAPYGGTCSFCTVNCTLQTVQGPKCGDGTQHTAEQCDDGSNNGVACNPTYGGSCSYCNSSCQKVTLQGAKCRDGTVQLDKGEQCDKGTSNGIVCIPTYNGSNCNYCNSSCQNISINAPKCGDGIVQPDNGEVCDDNNPSDYDSCSSSCKLTCSSDKIAKGSSCIPIACKGDYNRDGILDISDFSVFAGFYKKTGIACDKDIIDNGTCYLDITDFASFARVYKDILACK